MALLNMDRRAVRLAVRAVVVVCALVPFAASLADVGRGWLPVGDTAIVVTRSRDVFTADSPLLGQPSTAGERTGVQVHHPGPVEYWLIALGQKLVDHPKVSLFVIAVVNSTAVLSLLWWLRRLGGTRGLALGSPLLLAMLWSLRGDILISPLNPFAAVLPLSAYLVALVAALSGRRWALVWAALLGSYAAQAHLTVTGLVAAAAFTAIGIAVSREALRRRSADDRPDVGGRWRRPAMAAAALLFACWAGPLVDLVVNRGGNVVALASTGAALDEGTLGWDRAADISVRALGATPVWARPGADTRLLHSPVTARERWFVAGLWCAGLAGAVACRRRAPVIGVAFATATVVMTTGTLLMTRIPENLLNIVALGNYLWLWPASAFLWGSALAGILSAVSPRVPRRVAGAGLLAAATATTVLAAACAITPNPRPVPRAEAEYARVLSAQLARSLDKDTGYILDIDRYMPESEVALGVLHELIRRGFDLRVNGFNPSFGRSRGRTDGVEGGVLVLQRSRVDAAAPAADARLLAEYRPSSRSTRELAEAEEALAERIQRAGGASQVVGWPQLHPAGRSTEELVQGDFLGFQQTGFMRPDVAAWPETAALVEARSAPVDHVTVHLLPPPSSTTGQR